jgi:hypothetical protein
MGWNPSVGQIMTSNQRKISQIDRTLELENEKREALLTSAMLALLGIDEFRETRKQKLEVKKAGKNLGFYYDKKSNSFYKTGSTGTPLKIDFDRMVQLNESSKLSGDSLGSIIYGSKDGIVDFSKESNWHMNYEDQKTLIERQAKGNKWDIIDFNRYESASAILDKFDWKDKSSDFLDQVNLAGSDALEQINEHFGQSYGNINEYFADIQTQVDEGVDIKDLRKFGEYNKEGQKDTQLAIIGGKLSHVTTDEAKQIALDPSYADYMWELVGKKAPEINKTTGLPQYGLLGTVGGAVSAIPGWGTAIGGGMLAIDAIRGGQKAAAAAEAKIDQIDVSLGHLTSASANMSADKTEQMEDIYEAQDRAVDDITLQTGTALGEINKSVETAQKSTKGLKVGDIDVQRLEALEDTSFAATRKREEVALVTEQQATGLANKFDTQISDIAMNMEDLQFQQSELRKQDELLEQLW